MRDDKPLTLLHQTYAALLASAHGLQARGDRYVDALTSRQLMALLVIDNIGDGQATINAVARALNTTKQSMRQLIAKLEAGGLVRLLPAAHDRRAVNLVITERGRALMEANGDNSARFLHDAFEALSREETERLLELLTMLRPGDTEGDGQARSSLNAATDRRSDHDPAAV
ncbi:MarR family winged helix-turn-helix transcriptional regulator [Paenibacillus aurantiacus]|uniref:MarR family winged helix-turn-helix transcriptional regulator n=1 Tax=Paenibacillus aurantiacus TaxID=1936118 RepID=A0ABV5KW47_9BACL